MEKYYDSYQEALQANAANENKWRHYKKELAETKINFSEFIKSHSLEIMVPIGTKALVRGKLVHTNEIMVVHGSSYFSDCSANDCSAILDKRIENCDKQLNALEKERELFTNKIDLPQNTFGEGKEIIEDFDEKTESVWRQKHVESVKKQKLKDRQERQLKAGKDEDLNKIFDDFEMMEELAEELETMEIRDNETLKKILSGELKVPESKPRVAHTSIPTVDDESNDRSSEINNNDLIAQNNQEIVDLLRNYRCKIKEVLRNVKKDDERNVNLFLDLIELKDDIEDDIRRMNDDELAESDEKDSDDETTASIESKPPEDGKRVRFSKSLEDVKLIESKSEFFDASPPEGNTLQIHFQHSNAKFTPVASEDDTISHPGEIYAKFHKTMESLVPAKKSILKNKVKDGKIRETMDEKQVKKLFSSSDPVIGDVVEHKKEIQDEEIIHVAAKNEVPKKLSKFKQMRMKS